MAPGTTTFAVAPTGASSTASLTRLTEADTYLSMGPLFLGNSQFLAAYPSLIAGARYVMRERFSTSSAAEASRASPKSSGHSDRSRLLVRTIEAFSYRSLMTS